MAGIIRQSGSVEVQVVGAGALNQAVKAAAIARSFLVPEGLDLVCIPAFADIVIAGERRTAIRLCIEDRERRKPAAGEHHDNPGGPEAGPVTVDDRPPSSRPARATEGGPQGQSGGNGPVLRAFAAAVCAPREPVRTGPWYDCVFLRPLEPELRSSGAA